MINGYLHRIGWFSPDRDENRTTGSTARTGMTKSPDWQSLQPEEQMCFCNIVHQLRNRDRWESPIRIQWLAFDMILADRAKFAM